MGFSQGGSVVLDILGGGGGELWGCVQEDNPRMDKSTAPGSKGTWPSCKLESMPSITHIF